MTDILSESENLIRKYKPWYHSGWNYIPTDEALGPINVLKNLLIKGIEVVHHQFNGTITKSIFKYIQENGEIELKTPYTSYFGVKTYSYKVDMIISNTLHYSTLTYDHSLPIE